MKKRSMAVEWAKKRVGHFLSVLRSARKKLSFWVFLAVSITLIGLATLPEPSVLVSAEITTETVEVVVQNQDEAAFTLDRALALNASGQQCLNNVRVLPKRNSTVFVSRLRTGEVFIAFDGPTIITSSDEAGRVLDADQLIVSDKGDCALKSGLRLPVSGHATIGLVASNTNTIEEPSLLLLDGRLKIYGRATPRIFGIPVGWLWPLPMEADKLYLADEFAIPSGSQVGSETALWWGHLDIAFDQKLGFMFYGSTNALSLDLQAPAPKPIRSHSRRATTLEADEISLTFGARLSNDPNLKWAFAAISFMLYFFSVFTQALRTRDEL